MSSKEYPYKGFALELHLWVREALLTVSPPRTSEAAIDYALRDFALHPGYLIKLSFRTLSSFMGKQNAAIVMLHLPKTDENEENRKEARQYLVSGFKIKGVLKLTFARMD